MMQKRTRSKTNQRWKWIGINLLRLFLSTTFLFSGIVKLIDPRGVQYKIEDYAVWLGLYDWLNSYLALGLAISLGLAEFYIGFNLFFGIRRRTTSRFAALLLVPLLVLTLALAMSEVQMDCGCFGDALYLTPWQSFLKNVFLLASALVLIFSYRRMTRLISERNQWMLSLYSMLFGISLALYDVRYLPVMDFRPYHVGVDLAKSIVDEWNGLSEDFQYADFSILTLEGEDVTLEWLEQKGYKFLLVAPTLELAYDGSMDEINVLYEYCQSKGYPFLALTSSTSEAIDRWKDITGAEYNFALTDGLVLKTMVRSNPGLLLLHDGVIYQKWSCNNLPIIDSTKPLEETNLGQMQYRSQLNAINRLFLWFLVPLLLWTFADRIWIGSKLYKRYKIHKRIDSKEV